MYAKTIKDALRGRVIAIPLDRPALANAVVVIPEADIVAESVTATKSRLYVKYRDGGPSTVRMFGLDGKRIGDLPAEPVSDTSIGTRLNGDDLLVQTVSYLNPPTWFRFDAARDLLAPTQLMGKPAYDFKDASVVRDVAISKDGTKVPINILYRKGMNRNGRNPVLLYALRRLRRQHDALLQRDEPPVARLRRRVCGRATSAAAANLASRGTSPAT